MLKDTQPITSVVYGGASHQGCSTMAANSKKKTADEGKTARMSISFPAELYETLNEIAKEKKVSFGWVVREATEKYVEDRWPLLGSRQSTQPTQGS